MKIYFYILYKKINQIISLIYLKIRLNKIFEY